MQYIIAAINCLVHEKFKKKIRRIVEFGCSEMKFFVYMKNALSDRDVLINLVDIDKEVLTKFNFLVQPLTCDFIKKREHKLKVNIFHGSIAESNPNFQNIDACVCLELIEHVYPDVFEEIPYKVFGIIAPKIAIFSTPNCEFNTLFEMKEKFRHYDHKFEWNRNEFRDWCENICDRFPYCYQIEGIGTPPENVDITTTGHCSQLVLFIRNDFYESLETDNEVEEVEESNDTEISNIPCDSYELLSSYDYPFHQDNRNRNEKILDEAKYHVNRLRTMEDMYYSEENDRLEIPLAVVVECCWEFNADINEIRSILENEFKIENEMLIFKMYDNESDIDDDY